MLRNYPVTVKTSKGRNSLIPRSLPCLLDGSLISQRSARVPVQLYVLHTGATAIKRQYQFQFFQKAFGRKQIKIGQKVEDNKMSKMSRKVKWNASSDFVVTLHVPGFRELALLAPGNQQVF